MRLEVTGGGGRDFPSWIVKEGKFLSRMSYLKDEKEYSKSDVNQNLKI